MFRFVLSVKNSIAFAFILLYVLAMVQPIFPVVNYWVQYDYIVAELCVDKDIPSSGCNGKCYLKKTIKASSESEQESRTPSRKLNLEEYPIALIDHFDLQALIQLHVHSEYDLTVSPPTPWLSGVFHPPEFSA